MPTTTSTTSSAVVAPFRTNLPMPATMRRTRLWGGGRWEFSPEPVAVRDARPSSLEDAATGIPPPPDANIVDYWKKQRDMYKYLHDQSVNLMNKGSQSEALHSVRPMRAARPSHTAPTAKRSVTHAETNPTKEFNLDTAARLKKQPLSLSPIRRPCPPKREQSDKATKRRTARAASKSSPHRHFTGSTVLTSHARSNTHGEQALIRFAQTSRTVHFLAL